MFKNGLTGIKINRERFCEVLSAITYLWWSIIKIASMALVPIVEARDENIPHQGRLMVGYDRLTFLAEL